MCTLYLLIVGVPPKVSFLKAIKFGKTTAKLVWKKPSIEFTLPITHYIINVIKTVNKKRVDTKSSKVTSDHDNALIKDLDSTSAYVFTIAAINNIGKGEHVESSVIDMSEGKAYFRKQKMFFSFFCCLFHFHSLFQFFIPNLFLRILFRRTFPFKVK